MSPLASYVIPFGAIVDDRDDRDDRDYGTASGRC